jgi:hypothetical protein
MLAGVAVAHATADPPGRIERIEMKTEAASTKVFIMLSRPLPFEVRVLEGDAGRKVARRLVLDFANTTIAPEAVTPIVLDDGVVRGIRTGRFTASTARIVLDLASDGRHAVEAYESPPHVKIAIAGK